MIDDCDAISGRVALWSRQVGSQYSVVHHVNVCRHGVVALFRQKKWKVTGVSAKQISEEHADARRKSLGWTFKETSFQTETAHRSAAYPKSEVRFRTISDGNFVQSRKFSDCAFIQLWWDSCKNSKLCALSLIFELHHSSQKAYGRAELLINHQLPSTAPPILLLIIPTQG